MLDEARWLFEDMTGAFIVKRFDLLYRGLNRGKVHVPALLRQAMLHVLRRLRSKLIFAEFVTWVCTGVHEGPYLELFEVFMTILVA